MWFIFALLTTLAWGLAELFYKKGARQDEKYAHLKICICVGIGEHLLFFAKYVMQMRLIDRSIKGVTIDPGAIMPYFWDMENHTFYGYIAAILLVIFVQAYWNYAYYNKETKSVYVMRRLPDRKEYSRTIWIAPLMEALIISINMISEDASITKAEALSNTVLKFPENSVKLMMIP